jgi:hypothetical protein
VPPEAPPRPWGSAPAPATPQPAKSSLASRIPRAVTPPLPLAPRQSPAWPTGPGGLGQPDDTPEQAGRTGRAIGSDAAPSGDDDLSWMDNLDGKLRPWDAPER